MILQGHSKAITSVQFNWNCTDIAAAAESGEIILHNVMTGLASKPLVASKDQVMIC